MTEKELYVSLINLFGNKQLVVAIEELSELQKELAKALRGSADIAHIIEEIADVNIMIKQVMTYFNISNALVRQSTIKKLIRTRERYLKDES